MSAPRSCSALARHDGLSLIDVLSVPTIGAAALHCLRRGQSALRPTCSAICALVDQHNERLRLQCRGHQDLVIAGRLTRKAIRPKSLALAGSETDSSPSAITALLATEQHRPLFQRVTCLTLEGALPKNLPQDVFASMPLLANLTIYQALTEQSAQMLAAVSLETLHCLDVRMELCHAWFLQGCKQLKALTIRTANFKGVSAISQLTELTGLCLVTGLQLALLPAEEQSELGSTLAALRNLQSLSISHAPPGPVTQALSQLTGLTELTLSQQDLVHNPGPLILPSCINLTLYFDIAVQHLTSINAPQLQDLEVTLTEVKPSDLDALRWLCRGVLRVCNYLFLDLKHAWSKEETAALMQLLGQDWQPYRSNLTGLERRSSSNMQPTLQLLHTHCSRQSLKLIPKGLCSLHLGACTLDPDSLDPLAQVASLRRLHLPLNTGVTLAGLERLFSESVQGCLLKVCAHHCSDLASAEACFQMRQRVVAQRGSRDTPVLEIW